MPPGSTNWVCRRCGCTQERACRGGCCWIGPRLCSACGTDKELVHWEFIDIGAMNSVMLPEDLVGMTLAEIAADCKVKLSTLGVKIWEKHWQPEELVQIRGHKVGIWNRSQVQQIREMLLDKPIRSRPGNPNFIKK